jgi:translation initiation factor RLI1
MSKFNYNKQRPLELLKLKYSQEKVLTSTEKSELNEYSCLLDGTLDWETKEQYIDLFEKLISGKINSFQFYLEFRERNDLNGKVFDSLIANFFLLSPHEKSKEFSNFIIEIMHICMSYEDVFESYFPKEESDLHDLKFRNCMEEIYLKIQKFYLSASSLKPTHEGIIPYSTYTSVTF